MSKPRAIIVISRYLEQYVRAHSDFDCHLLRLPVYGDGPFPNLASFDAGCITMINPCELKGVSIFRALTREFAHLQFAAVPTWGANDHVLADLRALPNVRLLEPEDDIEKILAQTRILLVPSLWPETFGYVVPEAMLRGIPVLASNVGGLPEAKLGVDYVLPVTTPSLGEADYPTQDIRPWSQALRELVGDAKTYSRCSQQSRTAALKFVEQASTKAFTELLGSLVAKRATAMSNDSRAHLHPEFRRFIEKQPYVATLDGLRLHVDQDVFPPDMGLCAQNLAKIAGRYQPRVALDMGCGTGYLALMLKRHGVAEVWASDIHPPAVACAKTNVEMNPSVGPVTVVESDLFDGFSKDLRFDLIVFNQPFGPGQGERVCGCGADGGYEICKRFLLEAPFYLREQGVVLMAFSDREPAEHSPDRVALELGYPVTTVLHEYYNESNNFIFEIRPTAALS